ncbi:hypothetical protein QFZ53_000788 [Microbacterium natoriense]|uniref:Uncharacterized protein n=1 Tax=Microbacterium natoriense TaxID=284570 RepID=A0AAW8EW33_9MICO|nr:hypothetical protein [Microbacterium natoriense]MDQ0646592.1 hypothetical protein [Microbacterium natoriense]
MNTPEQPTPADFCATADASSSRIAYTDDAGMCPPGAAGRV